MRENDFQEGISLNTFGENFDHKGENLFQKMSIQFLGSSIDYLVEQKIMEIPDYIKIDVDGIENLILKGGENTLKNKKD